LLLSALCWLSLQRYIAAGLMVVFAVMEYITNKDLIIIFTEDGIIYPSFPQKIFRWSETDQVLIKDHVLTIDLKNNRLLQFDLAPDVISAPDISAFNQYCRQKCDAGLPE